ncbi:MAG: purine-nucleoside phosphorylase [Clostridiales bacterium]|nr:purine-nucleoside phosphorylase [Clostridiales bacterium]
MFSHKEYAESADFIERRLNGFKPEFLLILGSGLGFLGYMAEDPIYINYREIPHFKASTAPGHAGRFVAGKLSGKNILVMQGRLHIYEGCQPEEVAFPIRVAHLLGARSMIITNACGGVNKDYSVGELILLNDIIKFSYPNPLIGPNIDEFGPRFKDMSHIFDASYLKLAKEIGSEQGLLLKEGVYFYMTGPQYETPAEIRAIRVLGGDVVGMSTAPECLAANHCGMRTLGISLVTNMAAGILDEPLTEEEVLSEAEKAKGYFSKLVLEFLRRVE